MKIGKQTIKLPDPEMDPGSGVLLLAGANMMDTNFARTVVLLCEHQENGSFGLVLNAPMPATMRDAIEGVATWDAPLHRGGPVQLNTLHFIHRNPHLGIQSKEVVPGVFWGGEFDEAKRLLDNGKADPADFRFFIGYSGWGNGQLAMEIEHHSWYLTRGVPDLIFGDPKNQWRAVLHRMGPEYAILTSFPDNPSFN